MKHISMTEPLYQYLLDISVQEHPVLKALREKTAELPLSVMQIAPEQAQFMQFLLRTLNAKKVLELGTFTGYSALAMALALPDNGALITCDINTEWTDKAEPFWQDANQAHKITLKLGKALDTLNHLIQNNHANTFDFIFIDADKTNYLNYYECALQLLAPNGVIAIDNVLWRGDIINPDDTRPQTKAIQALNLHIKADHRVDSSLLPLADGLFLIRKK
jgi:predicted O-methyltransferase YrrM